MVGRLVRGGCDQKWEGICGEKVLGKTPDRWCVVRRGGGVFHWCMLNFFVCEGVEGEGMSVCLSSVQESRGMLWCVGLWDG